MSNLATSFIAALLVGAINAPVAAQEDATLKAFPVEAEVFVEGAFTGAEGITFNGEGHLYVTANRRLWRLDPDGTPHEIMTLQSTVGVASIGPRDLLVAEFGPTVRLRVGDNTDGKVLRVTPEGEVTVIADQLADPNFIHVRADGSLLASDDFSDLIWQIRPDGTKRIFTQAIPFPNGMVESPDGSALYVAQIFSQINPVVLDDRIWQINLDAQGEPHGDPKLILETHGIGGVDGLAMDVQGRVYVAANREGKIWRVDPATGESVVIAENVLGVASLVFGEGEFDHESLYATQTANGGGRIWRVPVGVRGFTPHRGEPVVPAEAEALIDETRVDQ